MVFAVCVFVYLHTYLQIPTSVRRTTEAVTLTPLVPTPSAASRVPATLASMEMDLRALVCDLLLTHRRK
jgi:hypothetical protein